MKKVGAKFEDNSLILDYQRGEEAAQLILKGKLQIDMQDVTTTTKFSAIDKALAAAQARKAAKGDSSNTVTDIRPSKPKGDKIKLDDASKTAAKMVREEGRKQRQEQLKTQREARRAVKALERVNGKAPHMKKIEKAAAALPVMSVVAQKFFDEITPNLSAEQVTSLALHLQHFNRVKATERALNQKLDLGQHVRIIGGPTKYVGMTGTVDRAQRIRCFINIPGVRKPVYLFTSDVELIAEMQATGTEG